LKTQGFQGDNMVREAGLEFKVPNFNNFFTTKAVILRSECRKIGTVQSIVFISSKPVKGQISGQIFRRIMMQSMFEKLGGTYTEVDGYRLPNVALPEAESRPGYRQGNRYA
jgi:hypothetical protein